MPFLACVEIHNADLPTYYRLHAAMEAESFKRVITGANDFKQYRMPLGTYWTDAFDDSWEAFNAAQRAALPIDATAQVILCGTGPILFQNCRQYVEQPILGLHSIRPTEPQRPAPKPRTVPLSEPAVVAEPHNPGQTQTHRPKASLCSGWGTHSCGTASDSTRRSAKARGEVAAHRSWRAVRCGIAEHSADPNPAAGGEVSAGSADRALSRSAQRRVRRSVRNTACAYPGSAGKAVPRRAAQPVPDRSLWDTGGAAAGSAWEASPSRLARP